jgi:hypothetical protein
MNGDVSHIFNVVGSNFTVANMTIGWVKNHAIQIHGEFDADTPLIHNVRIVDTGESMLKVSNDDGMTHYWGRYGSDKGIIEWCLFEYSTGTGPQSTRGGINAHQANDWIVRNNTFKNIVSPGSGLAEYAIHFWFESSGTVVTQNVITNCDRGIGVGFRNDDHFGGMIRNNVVLTTRGVGIDLENSRNVVAYNNTMYTKNENPIPMTAIAEPGGNILHLENNHTIQTTFEELSSGMRELETATEPEDSISPASAMTTHTTVVTISSAQLEYDEFENSLADMLQVSKNSPYQFFDSLYDCTDCTDRQQRSTKSYLVQTIDEYLQSSNEIVYRERIPDAFTMWRNEYNDIRNYIDKWTIDSKNTRTAMFVLSIELGGYLDTENRYNYEDWVSNEVQNFDLHSVPEPKTFLLLVFGLMGLIVLGKKKKNKKKL